MTDRQRIVFLLPGMAAHPVGGYKVVYAYANHLAEQGHCVTLLHSRILPRAGVNIRTSILAARDRFLGSGARRRWFSLDNCVHIENRLWVTADSLPAADIIVATSVTTAHCASDAAQLQRARGVYFIQHYEDWSRPSRFVDETWSLPLRLITISPWLSDHAARLGREARLVPNTVDVGHFRLGPPIAHRPLQAMSLVSREPWKRTDLVAETFALLKNAIPNLRGSTFGTCPRPRDLPAYVEHHRSPTPDALKGLYHQSRVYFCASDTEGWHLPASEALASGAALVSTDIPGVRAYADGVGLFSPPNDAESLAANVTKLMLDPGMCHELATAGRLRVTAPQRQAGAAAFESALLS